MIVVFLGPPGAGKGTYAEALTGRSGILHISTGDMLREAVSIGSELGKMAKSSVKKGELVSDEIMIGILKDRILLPDAANGFILDGFPRTIAQAEKLDEMLEKAGKHIDFILNLDVEDEEVVKRLSNRMVCSKCGMIYHRFKNPPATGDICKSCGGNVIRREDDKEETIRHRLEVYRKSTAPIIGYYKENKGFSTIDSNVSVADAVRVVLTKTGLA